MNTLIAVPSSAPGGLDAPLGAHFGHCDLYTLITVQDNTIKKVDVIPNVPDQQGGCMAPVHYLASKGAAKLIAGGMGFRPLMGFNQVGIQVYFGGNFETVGTAVYALMEGKLPEFSQEHTCGSGGAHPARFIVGSDDGTDAEAWAKIAAQPVRFVDGSEV